MKKNIVRLFTASALLSLGAVLSVPTLASALSTPAPGATTVAAPTKLSNPLGDDKMNLNQFIGRLISAALGLSGAVALLMFVWGGIQWLISGGNPKLVQKGKDTLTWAAIGIVVIFTSYTLVNVLINALASGST